MEFWALPSPNSVKTMYFDFKTVKLLNSHHQLLEAQKLGLVHDGDGEAAGEQRDTEEDHHGPVVADLKQTGVREAFNPITAVFRILS